MNGASSVTRIFFSFLSFFLNFAHYFLLPISDVHVLACFPVLFRWFDYSLQRNPSFVLVTALFHSSIHSTRCLPFSYVPNIQPSHQRHG